MGKKSLFSPSGRLRPSLSAWRPHGMPSGDIQGIFQCCRQAAPRWAGVLAGRDPRPTSVHPCPAGAQQLCCRHVQQAQQGSRGGLGPGDCGECGRGAGEAAAGGIRTNIGVSSGWLPRSSASSHFELPPSHRQRGQAAGGAAAGGASAAGGRHARQAAAAQGGHGRGGCGGQHAVSRQLGRAAGQWPVPAAAAAAGPG